MAEQHTPQKTHIIVDKCVICGLSFSNIEITGSGRKLKYDSNYNKKLKLNTERVNEVGRVVPPELIKSVNTDAHGICVKCFRRVQSIIKSEEQCKQNKEAIITSFKNTCSNYNRSVKRLINTPEPKPMKKVFTPKIQVWTKTQIKSAKELQSNAKFGNTPVVFGSGPPLLPYAIQPSHIPVVCTEIEKSGEIKSRKSLFSSDKTSDMGNTVQECSCEDWEVCSPGSSSTCTRKECPLLGPLQHGGYLGNLMYLGARKRILCPDGYRQQGAAGVIECLSSGEWNQTVTCKPVDCGDLPMINNGTLTLDEADHTTFGATASVTCNVGYQADVGVISCTASAKWQTASCELICPSNNGMLTLTNEFTIQFSTTNTTFLNASESCSASGMRGLLKLNEPWKIDILFHVVKDCQEFKNKTFWVDGRLHNSNAIHWKFVDGEIMQMDGPIQWFKNRPLDKGFPRCLTVDSVFWFDRWCPKELRFVCET